MENDTNTAMGTQAVPGPKEGGMGATLGIIVIILVIVAGGLYVWLTKNNVSSVPSEQASTEETPADTETQALMDVSASDSASAIEADLNMTNTGDASGDLQVQ